MVSSRSSTPWPVTAETGTISVLPPHSVVTSSYSVSCCLMRSGSAVGLSILLMATMISTPADLAWLMASMV